MPLCDLNLRGVSLTLGCHRYRRGSSSGFLFSCVHSFFICLSLWNPLGNRSILSSWMTNIPSRNKVGIINFIESVLFLDLELSTFCLRATEKTSMYRITMLFQAEFNRVSLPHVVQDPFLARYRAGSRFVKGGMIECIPRIRV